MIKKELSQQGTDGAFICELVNTFKKNILSNDVMMSLSGCTVGKCYNMLRLHCSFYQFEHPQLLTSALNTLTILLQVKSCSRQKVVAIYK